MTSRLNRPAFGHEEYTERLRTVQTRLQERHLDALVLTQPHNVYYVTGFRGADSAGLAAGMGQILAAVVPSEGDPYLLLRALETRLAEAYCWDRVAIHPYRDDEDAYGLLASVLPSQAGQVGIELLSITGTQLARLQQARDLTTVDASLLVDEIRRVKSSRELEYVRDAARLANLGMAAAIEAVGAGSHIRDVVAEATRSMYDQGQDEFMCPPAYGFVGPQGGIMHDSSLDATVHDGDVVTLGVNGVSHLYAAEALASVHVGGPSDDMLEAYSLAVALHDAAHERLQPGASGDEVHARVEELHLSRGLGPYPRRVGGAIGIYNVPGFFFEGYNLIHGERAPMVPGFVVNVQPGVVAPSMLIVHSMNLITDSGYEELVHPFREMVVR